MMCSKIKGIYIHISMLVIHSLNNLLLIIMYSTVFRLDLESFCTLYFQDFIWSIGLIFQNTWLRWLICTFIFNTTLYIYLYRLTVSTCDGSIKNTSWSWLKEWHAEFLSHFTGVQSLFLTLLKFWIYFSLYWSLQDINKPFKK